MNFEYKMYDLVKGFIEDIESTRYLRSLRSSGYDTLVLERSIGRPYPEPEVEEDEEVIPESYYLGLGECFYLYNRPYFKANTLPEELTDIKKIVLKNVPQIPNHMIGYVDEEGSVVIDCDLDGELLEEVKTAMKEGNEVEISSSLSELVKTIEKKFDVFSVDKNRKITVYTKEGHTYQQAQEMLLKNEPELDGFDRVVRVGEGIQGKAVNGLLIIGA